MRQVDRRPRTPLPRADEVPGPDVRAAAIRAEVEARRNGVPNASPAPEPPPRKVSVPLDAFGPVARELTDQVAEWIHNEILVTIRRHGVNVPAALLALEQAKTTLLIAERRRLGLPLA